MESISFHLFNPLCVRDFVCLYYGLCRSRAVSLSLSLSIHPLYSFRSIPFVLFLSVDFSLVISVFSVSLDRCAPLSLSTTAYRESPFYTHQNIIQLSFDFIQTVTLARSFAYFF